MATEQQLITKRAEILVKQELINDLQIEIEGARQTITDSAGLATEKAAKDDAQTALRSSRQTFVTVRDVLDTAVQTELDSQKGTDIANLATAKTDLRTLRQEYRALRLEGIGSSSSAV